MLVLSMKQALKHKNDAIKPHIIMMMCDFTAPLFRILKFKIVSSTLYGQESLDMSRWNVIILYIRRIKGEGKLFPLRSTSSMTWFYTIVIVIEQEMSNV